jgi:hypothetical protein
MKMRKNFSLPMQWKIFRMKWHFRKRVGYWPNIARPRSFNEKIQHRKYYWHDELFTRLADKYAVRTYVADKVGERYLVPLIAVLDDPSEVDFDAYGENYVLKLTHDSGGVFICKNNGINRAKTMRRMRRKFKRNMGLRRNEGWYAPIKPVVMVEQLLQDEHGNIPSDYKIHVFNSGGKRHCMLQVDYDRFNGHHRSFYDTEGKLLPFSQNKKSQNQELDPPKNLAEMYDLAAKLAGDIDYVRVDMYNIDGNIYFGELTFSHAGGFGPFTPVSYDFEVGKWWEINSPYLQN